eukprot:m.146759 g.146759  ORF g.146759 m.146759 type:complete len:364 (+) comp17775_c0_seq2:133-1224(+)
MSLADELLADLEALDSGDETLDVVDEAAEGGLGNADDGDAAMEVDLDDGMHGSISEIAKLSTSEQLTRIISSIDKFTEDRESQPQVMGPIEENPEYKLIVEGNNLTQEIDSELGVIHKFVRDNYAKRFPELEQLVLHPLDYIRTVKVMQNQMDCTHLDLSETIAPATIMVVSVTASTTQGKQLSEEELKRVLEACDMGLALNDAKNKIFDYVESRMFFLAPNVTHICGANTAAKMLGVAGGLTNLSKMPACNIQLLGSAKRSLAGFSAAAMLPHTGFVYYCEIVQKQPPVSGACVVPAGFQEAQGCLPNPSVLTCIRWVMCVCTGVSQESRSSGRCQSGACCPRGLVPRRAQQGRNISHFATG